MRKETNLERTRRTAERRQAEPMPAASETLNQRRQNRRAEYLAMFRKALDEQLVGAGRAAVPNRRLDPEMQLRYRVSRLVGLRAHSGHCHGILQGSQA